ncbi:unnamed protein product [Brugia pahangi]|uniref:Aminotransferase n=1 Tax=Brugia pahangi TaxID=6280 RepID=A0A0N4TGK3_BRUPA|nr:unnamed protein product [Brugia pahangi]
MTLKPYDATNKIMTKFGEEVKQRVGKYPAAFEYGNLKSLVEEEQKNLVLFESIDGQENSEIEPLDGVVKNIFFSCVGVGPFLAESR